MEIAINYQGKIRKVQIRESEKYPIETVYECNIEGVGIIELGFDHKGEPVQYNPSGGTAHTELAKLIHAEKDRVEKTTRTGETFEINVDYKGKNYELDITPIYTDAGTYYKVLHVNRFLFHLFPPNVNNHQWYAGHGYEGDKMFPATIGMAIENRKR